MLGAVLKSSGRDRHQRPVGAGTASSKSRRPAGCGCIEAAEAGRYGGDPSGAVIELVPWTPAIAPHRPLKAGASGYGGFDQAVQHLVALFKQATVAEHSGSLMQCEHPPGIAGVQAESAVFRCGREAAGNAPRTRGAFGVSGHPREIGEEHGDPSLSADKGRVDRLRIVYHRRPSRPKCGLDPRRDEPPGRRAGCIQVPLGPAALRKL